MLPPCCTEGPSLALHHCVMKIIVLFMTPQGSLTRPDLVREMAYLERLLYKNKQQHRTSGHFQQLIDVSNVYKQALQLVDASHCLLALFSKCCMKHSGRSCWQVHRCLQLWRRLDLPRSIAELAGHAKVTEDAREAQWLPMSQQQTSQPSGQLLLQQIVAGKIVPKAHHSETSKRDCLANHLERVSQILGCPGCRVMGMVQAAVHKAASSLSAQLALSFFVPLCLTALAILARVRVCRTAYLFHEAVYRTLPNLELFALHPYPEHVHLFGTGLGRSVGAGCRCSLQRAH